MYRKFSELKGCELIGTDGEVGHVRDVYFDDRHWHARYLVAETGSWLDRRRVLLSPRAAIIPGTSHERLLVNLTREQVRASPDVDTRKPISRQHEEALATHYGWPAYWSASAGGLGLMAAPVVAVSGPVAMPATPPPPEAQASDEPNLRSADEVRDHKIAASDGDIGHVEDFIFDDAQWDVRFIVVDTRNWLPGRKVLLGPQWISRISWKEQAVHVDLRRDSVEASPTYNPNAPLESGYAQRLMDHYGKRTPRG